ncbi:Hsp70 family protein [Rhodococcus marinonascens]|uniref:Hsp70 family protein n=1 Tax=Rhodococcus marinonascens TaxID=38311 RepID=UPI000932E79C|nr:Hsp70 family protein [Rhodococcus marinonascens]
MGSSLGMSIGAAGVGSALVTTSSNGAQNVEFRFLSADQSRSDLSHLVRSSISLMTTQVPVAPATPDAVAVAYRTPKQARAIRNAVSRQRHRVHLVPEAVAALSYLRHTGQVAQHATVAIADFGESGLSVVVVDQVTGTVLHADRTSDVSGRGIDDLIYGHVMGSLPTPHPLRYLDRALLSARCRVAKEQLSSEPSAHVDVDLQGVRPVEISRTSFDEIAAPTVHAAVEFIRATIADSARPPDALALVGGVANIPTIKATATDALTIQVVTVPEPDTATARGAALLAVSSTIHEYPATGSNRPVSISRVSGTLAGALVVGALVLSFGVHELIPPAAPNVFPVGTDMFQATERLATTTKVPTTSQVSSFDPPPTSEHSPGGVVQHTSKPEIRDAHARAFDSTTQTTTTRSIPINPAQRPAPRIEWPATPPLWPQVPGESPLRELTTSEPEPAVPTASPATLEEPLPMIPGSGTTSPDPGETQSVSDADTVPGDAQPSVRMTLPITDVATEASVS